jgi:hypothetical protein
MSNKVGRIRQAKRRGWRVISVKDVNGPNTWNQLYDWIDKNATGKYAESFYLQEIAFELEKDANWFMLRWL